MLELILSIAFLFTAISFLSALALARSRRRRAPSDDIAPWADPYTFPFGEVAPLPAGSIIELHEQRHRAKPGQADGRTAVKTTRSS